MFAEEKTPTAGSLLAQAQAQSTRTMSTQAPIRRHGLPHELTAGSPPPQTFLGTTPSPSTAVGSSSSQLPGGISHLTPASNSIRLTPQFPSIEEAIGANSTSPEGVAAREVWGWFVDHLDALLDSIRNWRCDQFEMHLRQFWSSLSGNHREVVHAPAVAGLMAKADAILYDVRWVFTTIGLLFTNPFCRKFWRFCDRRCCRPSPPRLSLLSSNWPTRWRKYSSSPLNITETRSSSRRLS